MLFIPAYTGLRLAAERSDVNVDLLFVTTLRPRAIIWGKFLAGFILAMLIFSACAPFMTFTYLLRGIDVPSILCVLAIDFLAVLVAVQLVIFVAVIPANRVFKSVLGMLCFVALTYLFVGTLAGTLMVVEFGIASFMDRLEFWASAVSAALTVLAESALFPGLWRSSAHLQPTGPCWCACSCSAFGSSVERRLSSGADCSTIPPRCMSGSFTREPCLPWA